MPKFDAQKFLQENFGLKIVGRDSENPDIVEVEDLNPSETKSALGSAIGGAVGTFLTGGSGAGAAIGGSLFQQEGEQAVQQIATKKFNVAELMKDVAAQEGIDPAQLQVKVSDENVPLKQSALNFVDGFKFANTRTDRDKAMFLAEQFGQENVRKNQNGEWIVKQGDDWKKADSSFVSEMAAESPAIAGSIAGGKAGAAIGTTLGPKGTLVGGAIGAGIGGAIGKLASLKAAEQAGLRTEDDAKQVLKEMGTEFLFGMAGEAALPAARVTADFVSAKLGNSMAKIAKNATTPAAKENIAAIVGSLNGVPKQDLMTYMDAPDQVTDYLKRAVKWSQEGAEGPNPLLVEMGDMVQTAVEKARTNINNSYKMEMAKFEPAVKGVKIKLGQALGETVDQFRSLGLVDESGTWLKEAEKNIAEIADRKSVNQLKQAYGIVRKAVVNGDALPEKDVRTLISNVDDILEVAGAYNAKLGEQTISSSGVAQLTQLRSRLKNTYLNGIKSVSPDAAKAYEALTTKYSAARGWLDEMLPGTADAKVTNTIRKIVDSDIATSEAFANVLNEAGINTKLFMKGLKQRRAAISASDMVSNRTVYTASNAVRDPALGGVFAIGSMPRTSSKLTANTFNSLKTIADGMQFVNKLTPEQKAQLVRQPDLMRMFSQTITRSLQQQEQAKEELLAPLKQGGGMP